MSSASCAICFDESPHYYKCNTCNDGIVCNNCFDNYKKNKCVICRTGKLCKPRTDKLCKNNISDLVSYTVSILKFYYADDEGNLCKFPYYINIITTTSDDAAIRNAFANNFNDKTVSRILPPQSIIYCPPQSLNRFCYNYRAYKYTHPVFDGRVKHFTFYETSSFINMQHYKCFNLRNVVKKDDYSVAYSYDFCIYDPIKSLADAIDSAKYFTDL
jgi:hypothetical protein